MAKSVRKSSTERKSPDVIVRFDYSQVAAEHREALKLDAYEIRSELITAATSLMRAGQRLTRWRDILPHGAWLPWVVAETGMSEQWARDAMNVFRRFGHAPTLLADLDIALPQTAIVRLATAPEDAFDDIIERVSQGERLRASDVTDIVKTHRKRLKAEEGETDSSALSEPIVPSAADALMSMAETAHDELVPLVVRRLVAVLYIIEDAETSLAAGKSNKRKLEHDLRGHAQWLTDALEQLSGRRAASDTKLVHHTMIERTEYEPGPWADAATFLRDIAHSLAWEKILADDVPALLKRGREVLTAVLSPDERRSFFRMPAAGGA